MSQINLLEQSKVALELWREKEKEWGINGRLKLAAVHSGILKKIAPDQVPDERFRMSDWRVWEIANWKRNICRIALRALGFSALIDLSIEKDDNDKWAMFGRWDGRPFDPESTCTLEQIKDLLEHLDEHRRWSPDAPENA